MNLSKKMLQVIISQFDRGAKISHPVQFKSMAECKKSQQFKACKGNIRPCLTFDAVSFGLSETDNIKGMKKILFPFLPALLFLLTGCKNDKRAPAGEEGDGPYIYFDYEINGEEGFDKLTVLARFRNGGENDETITLAAPEKVELDGEIFPADSAALSGTYYELNKPVETFAGSHSIAFTDFNGKKYTEKFDFEPLGLATAIADTLYRNNISFEFTGVKENERVKVLMTDTSFVNDGVMKWFTVKNGGIRLALSDLASLANGPIQLELIKEEDREIEKGTLAGGRLRSRYVLRRSFFLTDGIGN